jgi:AraC-like DNA-binding protein
MSANITFVSLYFGWAASKLADISRELIMTGSRVVSKTTRQGGLARWQIELAVSLLLNDSSSSHSLKQIAAHCGLSRSYFEKAFKLSVGTPPHRWLVRQRIQRAAEKLEQTNDSVSSIALSCGFTDQSHLTRVFGAIVGSSPAAWRRQRKASRVMHHGRYSQAADRGPPRLPYPPVIKAPPLFNVATAEN